MFDCVLKAILGSTKAKFLQVNHTQFISPMVIIKKLEIEKTNPTFVISVLKVEY